MNKASLEQMLKTVTILYVENDNIFIDSVKDALIMKCNNVFIAKNINEAKTILDTQNITILITEIILDDTLIIDFITNTRIDNKNLPIIVISHMISTEILLKMVKLNLIDYILKPISLIQLREALIQSVIMMLQNGTYEINFSNNITYNVNKKILLHDNKEIMLTHNEISLLNALVVNQHCVLSKETLKEMVWSNSYYITDEAFKTLVSRLRSKIGKKSIKNISSSGYILNLSNE